MSKQVIGFIGVGLMGHGMAKNIVEKGYPLTIMARRNRAPVEDLVGRGAREAKTAFRVVPVGRAAIERDVRELRKATDFGDGDPSQLRAFDMARAHGLSPETKRDR